MHGSGPNSQTGHVCKLNDPWPTGHPLPPEDPDRLKGPELGEATYRRVRRSGKSVEGELVWTEDVVDLPATVTARSYVWSPGECRHKGGYRHYDWSVITVHEPGREYTVVVDDKDLS